MSEQLPLVSVILPVYNSEKYLYEALASIVDQTYKNMEIIVINDGSTDSSISIINEFANIDGRIKIINRENKGLIFSLNEGISIAKGKYIARMDADDISLPKRIEKQVLFLNENTNTIICGTQYESFGYKKSISNLPVSINKCANYLLLASPFCHPSVMFRSNSCLFNSEYKHSEDYKYWCDLSFYGDFQNIDEVLIKYRIHKNQVSKIYSREQVSKQILISKEFLLKKFNVSNDCKYSELISRLINDYCSSQDIKSNLLYILPFMRLINIKLYFKLCIKTKKIYIKDLIVLLLRYVKWYNVRVDV